MTCDNDYDRPTYGKSGHSHSHWSLSDSLASFMYSNVAHFPVKTKNICGKVSRRWTAKVQKFYFDGTRKGKKFKISEFLISRFGCQLSAVSYQLDSNAADC